jgi:DNA modification methylase
MTTARLDPAYPLRALAPNAANPRRITPAHRAQLEASLRRHGHLGVLVARALPGQQPRLIAGHQRLELLLALGETHAATYLVACDSDAEEQHLSLVLNSHAGTWDTGKLDAYLRALTAAGELLEDLPAAGDKQIADLLRQLDRDGRAGLTHPDDIPATATTPARSQPGFLWALGEHRLLVGDSTNNDDLRRLCPMHEEIDLVVVDPPYGVAYEGAAGTIANDDLPEADLVHFLTAALGFAHTRCRPGAPIYCCHSDGMGLAFRTAAREAGWDIRQNIIWVKDRFVLGRQDYQWRHEPILYGWKPGAAHRWYGGRAEDTVWELQPEHLTTVWKIDRPTASPDHPTTKPVALIERMLVNSSRPGDLVLDSFGGSGSTLIACERLGRRARLIELSPRYADVIVRRWEQHTGRTAYLVQSP